MPWVAPFEMLRLQNLRRKLVGGALVILPPDGLKKHAAGPLIVPKMFDMKSVRGFFTPDP